VSKLQLSWPEITYPQQQYYTTNHNSLNHTQYNQPDHHFAQAFSKGIKLDFPKFDRENHVGWLRQAEKFFALAETPLHKRVKFAEVFLIGKADHWLRSTGINTNSLTWLEFAELINSRVAAEISLELIDTFQHIEQSSNLSAYIDNFEELMGKMIMNPMLPDEYFVGCFISGLKEHIKVPLRSHKPTSLVELTPLHGTMNITTREDKIMISSEWGTEILHNQSNCLWQSRRRTVKQSNQFQPNGRKENVSSARNLRSLDT
jgi:hypothetical protein